MKVYLSSLTLQNFLLLNDLNKIEVKIEDENETLLLLCPLPSSYKRFREGIIYGGKSTTIYGGRSTIKINEVKEHLLNKNKIDTKLTGESRHDESGQVHYSREKSNNESFMGNSRHKSLTCNYRHKKGHIRVACWLRKKKQPDANVTRLIGEDEEQCDVLSVIDRSVGNKYR